MAIVMMMAWEGVTLEEYDQVREVVNWEGDPPTGGMLHLASFDGSRLRVTDVWETAQHWEAFLSTRLMPGIQQVGLQGQPEVEVHPVHALFTPAFHPSAVR